MEIEFEATVVKGVRIFVEKSSIDGKRIVEIVSKTLAVSPQIIRVIYSE